MTKAETSTHTHGTQATAKGPLCGIKVVEIAGLGPAPFCGMLLSDMGAEVIRIDRPGGEDYKPEDVESRGRHSVVLDLKSAQGKQDALALIASADILIEGFRPGAMERLGLGPENTEAVNKALVYGRMTGWGQTGPLANKAGHDLNYLALTGALHALGSKEKPAVPLNLIADFGGGALYLAMGVLAALHHAQRTGEGQVVDCAMTDGVISMMGMIYGDFAVNRWNDEREDNVIDGAAPFYNVYQCADEQWISLAAIEPQFFKVFVEISGITISIEEQWKKVDWPRHKEIFATFFAGKTRDEWLEEFEGHDVCLAPVLSLQDAQQDAHNQHRSSFVEVDGIVQPAPAPRFSRTPGQIQFGPQKKNAE